MKTFLIAKSRRLRGTPYTSRIEKQGVTAYTIYNHMLLPAAFGSVEDAYHHLKEHVQIWDVAAERQVEISGKDSAKLVQLMTCRNLSDSKIFFVKQSIIVITCSATLVAFDVPVIAIAILLLFRYYQH